MKIHEYQGKEILRILCPVPRGDLAFTVQEAVEAAKPRRPVGGHMQIHAGGRGRRGGVKVLRFDRRQAHRWRHPGHAARQHQTGLEGQSPPPVHRRSRDIKRILRVLVDRPRLAKVAFIASSAAWTSRKWPIHTEKIITEFI
jgi:hypothetical protein